MERTTINFRINDDGLLAQFNHAMAKEQRKYKFATDGIRTIKDLEIIFTASKIKNFRDNEHYLIASLAQKQSPLILNVLNELKDKFEKVYQEERNITGQIIFFKKILEQVEYHDKIQDIDVLISPHVMLFINITALADNIIKQLRVQYLNGSIDETTLLIKRNKILKQYAALREKLYEMKQERKKLFKKVKDNL
ncbi:hypothetical protein V3W87_004443 [Salmonella enterica]|nr:hypothetical protein [Salmonella enterica]EKT6585197.1 hypothetical protein [Salmonella enterica]EME3124372.1 hypothetical protein [Salmonella enterica]